MLSLSPLFLLALLCSHPIRGHAHSTHSSFTHSHARRSLHTREGPTSASYAREERRDVLDGLGQVVGGLLGDLGKTVADLGEDVGNDLANIKRRLQSWEKRDLLGDLDQTVGDVLGGLGDTYEHGYQLGHVDSCFNNGYSVRYFEGHDVAYLFK
ncbi:hypothetical protein DACRYDRAFT_106331 [Dacryopinax primogenitus]|uniref:Uncharacterized protein n=1 Tax=Dacryopinax primogenitus (strain DJM 731) TaxID=1858805 RepID=M5FYP8_DACPD|nr:uncharacterized protein DACRYDRAFT_106331 [Dacryopinax primogenitus]EJU03161.1 hypothetical protein DACRYDRAFT_106331 [Dacryopinax primogenitus]